MWFLSAASAATLVVDQTGHGDALTIEDALALAVDGDTIHIHAGTYVEGGLTLPVDNLTLTGAGPQHTIIDMSSWENASAFELSGNWTLVDIGFVAPLKGGTAVYYFNRDGGDTDVGVIQNCRFEGFNVTIYPTGPFDTLYVLDSVFVDPGYPIMTGFIGPSGPLHVENNVFVDANAIVLEEDYSADTGHFVFWNNTFIRGACGVARPGYRAYSTLEFKGNIAAGSVCGVSVADDRGDTVSHNLGHGLDHPFVYGENIEDAHDNLEADPEFCAWSSEMEWADMNLRLQEGSPAIDLLPTELSPSGSDNEGGSRPIDGDGDGRALSDAGAFEFGPARVCTSLPQDTGFDDTGYAVDTAVIDTQDSAPVDTQDSPRDSPADSLSDLPGDSPSRDSSTPDRPEPEPTCGCAGVGGALILPGLLLLALGRRRASVSSSCRRFAGR